MYENVKLSSIISQMVHCNSTTLFAAIGAAFIGYKVLTLLKTLFDAFVASGIPVSVDCFFFEKHARPFAYS